MSRARVPPVAAAGLLGGLLAALVFGGYLLVRHLTREEIFPSDPVTLAPRRSIQDFLPAPDNLVALLVATVAGALAGLVIRAQTAWSYRRHLARLEHLAADLRGKPHLQALVQARSTLAPDLAGVWQQLARLASCYRSALTQMANAQDKLDQSRSASEKDRARIGLMQFVIGSSRHRMVARLAPNLHLIAATLPLRQFLGRSGSELLAHSFLDLVHPEDAPTLRRLLKEALKDGEGHDISFRVMLPPMEETATAPAGPAASERFLQMDVMTCYDEAGTPLHLRCHFLDITDRVLTERELLRITREVQESNNLLRQTNEDLERLKESYRDLYHYAPVLYFSLDPAGKLVAFNETMLRTLGYPRTALLGMPYDVLLTPAGKAGYLADPTALQRQGEIETQWVKRDGTVIDVWIGTTTIRDLEGAFLRSRSAARDVTELRRKAEEASRANIQLRRINQELEEFTYVVSHDLKEPLRTLEAFSKFLATDYGPLLEGDGQDYINHLVQASRRLGSLIDDLLTLSRTGRVIHTPRVFAWEPVINTVLRDLHDLIQRKKAIVRVQGELPPVKGDPERVMQLLANLVANGLNYNNSPTPEVIIGAWGGNQPAEVTQRIAGQEGSPDRVTLYVHDNGIGIDPAYHDQIFRLFRRLHRRDEVEGTGAGLAICKRIVEAHGGRLQVESQAGKGATFYFALPRANANAAPLPPHAPVLLARPENRPRRTEIRHVEQPPAPGG